MGKILNGFHHIMYVLKCFVYRPYIIIPIVSIFALVLVVEVVKFNKLRKNNNNVDKA